MSRWFLFRTAAVMALIAIAWLPTLRDTSRSSAVDFEMDLRQVLSDAGAEIEPRQGALDSYKGLFFTLPNCKGLGVVFHHLPNSQLQTVIDKLATTRLAPGSRFETYYIGLASAPGDRVWRIVAYIFARTQDWFSGQLAYTDRALTVGLPDACKALPPESWAKIWHRA